MDKFISALEQENPGAVSVLVHDWWPARLKSFEDRIELRACLHGAMIFSHGFSEAEKELDLLKDIAHEYAMEALIK